MLQTNKQTKNIGQLTVYENISCIYAPTIDTPQNKRPTQTENEGMEKKLFQANGPEKNAGVAIPVADKIDFKTMAIKRHKGGCYIILKGTIHQEYITL